MGQRSQYQPHQGWYEDNQKPMKNAQYYSKLKQ